jgi:hypothetical protein
MPTESDLEYAEANDGNLRGQEGFTWRGCSGGCCAGDQGSVSWGFGFSRL